PNNQVSPLQPSHEPEAEVLPPRDRFPVDLQPCVRFSPILDHYGRVYNRGVVARLKRQVHNGGLPCRPPQNKRPLNRVITFALESFSRNLEGGWRQPRLRQRQ